MSKNNSKAVAIIWLNEMKEKGRKRLGHISRQYASGQSELYELQQAKRKLEAITALLEVLTVCQLSLAELKELLQGMKPQKQRKLFKKPQQPN